MFVVLLQYYNRPIMVKPTSKQTLSSAERQRLYRQRHDADPARQEAYKLQKAKEAWYRKKIRRKGTDCCANDRTRESSQKKVLEKRSVAEHLPNSSEQAVNITNKTDETTSKQDLLERFQNSLQKFKRHLFNIRHQFSVYHELRQNLTSSECIIHIDFSENFTGKFGSKIQSVLFGGSHKQVILCNLHTNNVDLLW